MIRTVAFATTSSRALLSHLIDPEAKIDFTKDQLNVPHVNIAAGVRFYSLETTNIPHRTLEQLKQDPSRICVVSNLGRIEELLPSFRGPLRLNLYGIWSNLEQFEDNAITPVDRGAVQLLDVDILYLFSVGQLWGGICLTKDPPHIPTYPAEDFFTSERRKAQLAKFDTPWKTLVEAAQQPVPAPAIVHLGVTPVSSPFSPQKLDLRGEPLQIEMQRPLSHDVTAIG